MIASLRWTEKLSCHRLSMRTIHQIEQQKSLGKCVSKVGGQVAGKVGGQVGVPVGMQVGGQVVEKDIKLGVVDGSTKTMHWIPLKPPNQKFDKWNEFELVAMNVQSMPIHRTEWQTRASSPNRRTSCG